MFDRSTAIRAHIGNTIFGLVAGFYVFGLTPSWANAEPIEIEASASVSSSYIDRGETLALENSELEILIIKPTSEADIRAGAALRTPIGRDSAAFDDELGFTIGAGFEKSGGRIDLNASYLSFPGSDEAPSVELDAELSLAQRFNPSLSLFYDLRSDTRGAEVALTHGIDHHVTNVELVLRGGLVDATESDYSYIGLDGAVGLYESENSAFVAFISGGAADEDTFVSDIRFDGRPRLSAEGWSIGVRLTSTGTF